MKFESLTADEISRVLNCIPLEVLFTISREQQPVVIAGGVIRDTVAGMPVKDVDIFCHSQEQAERLALSLSSFVKRTTFAYSITLYDRPIQFVYYKAFDTPEELIGQFDFRACCAGIYWRDEWAGLAAEGFRDDCFGRILTFMSQAKDAGKLTALGRALKFAPRGWLLDVHQAAAIVTHWQPTLDVQEVRRSFRPHYGRL